MLLQQRLRQRPDLEAILSREEEEHFFVKNLENLQGDARDGRTLAREAYFLEFARDIAKVARMPLMVTGGIRRRAVAEQVIGSGIAMASRSAFE